MSLPLRDFRGGVTHLTHAALDARSRATGKTMQDILRDVMHEWALGEYEAASLLTAAAERDGLVPESTGKDSA